MIIKRQPPHLERRKILVPFVRIHAAAVNMINVYNEILGNLDYCESNLKRKKQKKYNCIISTHNFFSFFFY